VKELLAMKRAQGLSERHLDDLRKRLGRFAKSCSVPVHEVTAARVQDFLVGMKVSGRTQNNFRMSISNMFNFARLRGYVGKDQNPAAEVPPAKEVQCDVGIFTPDEMNVLLENALDRFKPYLAIAAFAGLRTAEIERLDWRDVGVSYIKVRGCNSKTGAHRLVEIQPNLQQWLARSRKPSGPVVLVKNVTNAQVRLIEKVKVKWKHNGLRHSFGSYRLAVLKDPAKVAYEMGNSPRMVFAHYRELVTAEEAASWFGLFPPSQEKATVNQPNDVAAEAAAKLTPLSPVPG
jgi:integrase